jgi:predicted transcriptional regulator
MAAVCISLDEETNRRLDKLVDWSSTKTNRSKIIRELIDKEYATRKEANDAK